MRILETAARREVDRVAIEELGLPGIVLMENAALGVVDATLEAFPDISSAVVFCGPGNNGGDGLAIARQLLVRGLDVRAIVATGGREYSGDAAVHYRVAQRLSELELFELDAKKSTEGAVRLASRCEVVVDALFGTGLSRPLSGQFADLVSAINTLEAPCVAVDLPSGLNGDAAKPLGPHIEADLTVTFAAPQPAHFFPPAAEAVGALVVADLGIPDSTVERAEGDLHLLELAELAPLLGPRPVVAHKGTFGHLLVVGGSTGKTGAAILASRAAVRTGAGLVTAAVPETVLDPFESASIESMSVPLPVTASEGLGPEAAEALAAAVDGKEALALGPGLGTDTDTVATVRKFCLEASVPLVLDADGLNAFAGRLETLAAREAATVLTPHPGELARLLDTTTESIVVDRVAAVRRAAELSGAVVVLKGHLSLVADPEGGVYVNPTGNPGMATGGSGDVLTGLVGALLAQRMEAISAACLGVFVHGMAGDLVADRMGEVSLAANDLVEALPLAFEAMAGRARDDAGGEGDEGSVSRISEESDER